MEDKTNLKSGEFLVRGMDAKDIFIPEEFDEEQLMIAQTCADFLATEIYSRIDEVDKKNPELMAELVRKAGELGLLGVAIPEEFEGFGQNFVTQMLVSEYIGAGYSFSVAFMANTGIGTMPIMYYGNEEQRQKYIPKLATGELLGAYCLTEPGAGSDANSGKTKAVLSEDGKHYILNGQKMWITNAGFADVFTVFAKIDNDRVLSAFIVEKDMPGFKVGAEEKKMGINGSSTCQLYFTDCKVPVENLLGKRGGGFRIALNILHMGRVKLGGNVLGSMKKAIIESVRYANERKQFNLLISSFGAIKYKLAQQVIKAWTTESAVYRVSKDIDDAIERNKAEGMDYGLAAIDGIAQYPAEAALLKVYGSESLDYIADESVQIFGGMGYSAETLVEKGYRDSRINRIFEGTNEINRILITEQALKKSMKTDYDINVKAKELLENLDSISIEKADGYYEEKKAYLANFKNAALLMVGAANETFGRKVFAEQEIIMNISNMIMEIYIAESTLLRVEKLESIKGEAAAIYKDILDVTVYDAASLLLKEGKDAINSFANEKADEICKALKALTTVAGVNVKDARRRIADKLIEDNDYKF